MMEYKNRIFTNSQSVTDCTWWTAVVCFRVLNFSHHLQNNFRSGYRRLLRSWVAGYRGTAKHRVTLAPMLRKHSFHIRITGMKIHTAYTNPQTAL